MPYLVVCPNCATKLKSPAPLGVGRSLSCPMCKGQFTLSEPAVAIDATGRPVGDAAPPSAAPPKSPPAPTPAPPPIPTRAPAARRPDDDIPAAEFVDDDRPPVGRLVSSDDRRPSRRRPANDQEDRPRSRRRPLADDEDRPREDEDDRPRAARARDADDFEDDDRYVPPPRTRKKKRNRRLLIGLITGAAALLFCCGGGSVLYFADPFGLFGGASSDMLAWAPADSQAVMYMDVEGLNRVPEVKDQMNVRRVDVPKFGIRTDEVSAILGAGRTPAMGGDPDVLVIQLKSNADQAALVAANGGTEATAGGKKYYRTRTGGGLYFPSKRLVVIAHTESILTARLGKDDGKVVISEDLRAATKRGDGLVWIAGTGQAAEQMDVIGMMTGFANMFGPGGFGPGRPAPAKPPRPRSVVMSMKASGGTGTVRYETTYESSDTAQRVAGDLQRALDANRAKIESGESVEVSSSGATVTLKATGPLNKRGRGMFPFGMAP